MAFSSTLGKIWMRKKVLTASQIDFLHRSYFNMQQWVNTCITYYSNAAVAAVKKVYSLKKDRASRLYAQRKDSNLITFWFT